VTTGSIPAGALAACMMIFALGVSAADAADRSAKTKLVPKVPAVTAYSSSKASAMNEPAATGTIGAATDEDANCTKSRKRLWVEGEGWLVRRVTTCF
jgi:hypothetical protein